MSNSESKLTVSYDKIDPMELETHYKALFEELDPLIDKKSSEEKSNLNTMAESYKNQLEFYLNSYILIMVENKKLDGVQISFTNNVAKNPEKAITIFKQFQTEYIALREKLKETAKSVAQISLVIPAEVKAELTPQQLKAFNEIIGFVNQAVTICRGKFALITKAYNMAANYYADEKKRLGLNTDVKVNEKSSGLKANKTYSNSVNPVSVTQVSSALHKAQNPNQPTGSSSQVPGNSAVNNPKK